MAKPPLSEHRASLPKQRSRSPLLLQNSDVAKPPLSEHRASLPFPNSDRAFLLFSNSEALQIDLRLMCF
ncbi:hypothetical protein [Dactylococcopsis salina]|uniref:hypothetical protein n=1 Tax=Dactylococcopsis salina TaxID=292566 RepID=UPI0012EAF8BC|nr:hypothetical protein [Dactylococcopsis salina]